MRIEKNSVVTINYTLKGDDENVIDTSVGQEPLIYMHGNNYLLPKLEERIEGHETGDKIFAVLSPSEAYGEYDENLVAEIPRENFEFDGEIAVGSKFQADTPQGPAIVTVSSVSGDKITVDANHELAGKTLHFEVEILDVREATQEEIRMQSEGGCGCGGCSGCGDGCGSSCGGNCSCGECG